MRRRPRLTLPLAAVLRRYRRIRSLEHSNITPAEGLYYFRRRSRPLRLKSMDIRSVILAEGGERPASVAAKGGSALFGMLRRKPAIRDAGELSDFIDENAAFLVQKGIYEYSRARAGHYAKILFAEQAFLKAVEESRW